MKKLIVIGVIAAVVLGLVGWGISTYTDIRNDGRNTELSITARYKAMQSSYGQGSSRLHRPDRHRPREA